MMFMTKVLGVLDLENDPICPEILDSLGVLCCFVRFSRNEIP